MCGRVKITETSNEVNARAHGRQRYDTGLGLPFIRPTYIATSKLYMHVVLLLISCHWGLKEHTCGVSFGNDSFDIETRVSPSFIIMNGINNDVTRSFRSYTKTVYLQTMKAVHGPISVK